MGRKIPAKKHRGVKDPLKQQAQRLQSLKSKINAPPQDPDDQPVPHSLTRLFAFASRSNLKKTSKKKHTQLSHDTGPRRNRGVAALARGAGESARAFSLRINSAMRALRDDAPAEYPADVDDEDVKGEAMEAVRAQRRGRRRDGKDGSGPEPRLDRAQRRALKRKAAKEKHEEAAAAAAREAVRRERVAFGEVVHAPPALALPRGAATKKVRHNLLLAGVLAGNEQERAREAAVAAYRQLKKERAQLKTRA